LMDAAAADHNAQRTARPNRTSETTCAEACADEGTKSRRECDEASQSAAKAFHVPMQGRSQLMAREQAQVRSRRRHGLVAVFAAVAASPRES
jgi:hypothetical protein